jgi:hypothetical protein
LILQNSIISFSVADSCQGLVSIYYRLLDFLEGYFITDPIHWDQLLNNEYNRNSVLSVNELYCFSPLSHETALR